MESDWVSLLNLKPFKAFPKLERFIKLGAEASVNLDNLKADLQQGFDPASSYCEFRKSIVSLLYLLASIVEKVSSNTSISGIGKGKVAFQNDVTNLIEWLHGPEADRALNEAREGRVALLRSQIGFMESLLDSYLFDLIRIGYEETIQKLEEKVVIEALRKGGLVPKFKELRRKGVGESLE